MLCYRYNTDIGSVIKEIDMNWTTPTAQDMRFGFEITMYIANR